MTWSWCWLLGHRPAYRPVIVDARSAGLGFVKHRQKYCERCGKRKGFFWGEWI